jgi:hypothetical protein
MTKAEIGAAIDAALEPARERLQQADEPMRALLPCETDWATSEELAELHRLQMELIPLRQADRAGARQRADARRRARRAAKND